MYTELYNPNMFFKPKNVNLLKALRELKKFSLDWERVLDRGCAEDMMYDFGKVFKSSTNLDLYNGCYNMFIDLADGTGLRVTTGLDESHRYYDLCMYRDKVPAYVQRYLPEVFAKYVVQSRFDTYNIYHVPFYEETELCMYVPERPLYGRIRDGIQNQIQDYIYACTGLTVEDLHSDNIRRKANGGAVITDCTTYSEIFDDRGDLYVQS